MHSLPVDAINHELNIIKAKNENIVKNEALITYPKKQSRKDTNIIVKGTIPYKRQDVMKWYGWGYTDSQFNKQDGITKFSGNRYPICNIDLGYFVQWLKDTFDYEEGPDEDQTVYNLPKEGEYPISRISGSQLDALKKFNIKISLEGSDRLIRSHGQGFHDLDSTKRGRIVRIPDAVIWPECHEDVVEIVRVCDEHNIVITPFGGGTSVSGAITCPEDEERTILLLDTSMMNEILWVDKESMLACCESGIIGQDLERELQKLGYTCGHEPDSYEFSTLGGWVATRASGMKKNRYGNIEDIVVHSRMVTPRGVLEKGTMVPRISSGPDFNHLILGSEGSFGVITEVTIKICHVPEFKRYGALMFPDFDSGFAFMKEVAQKRLQPASLRLMDNEQFQFGRVFRPGNSYASQFLDGLTHFYLTKVKGFDLSKVFVATLLYEGDKDDVVQHEAKINAIAAKHGGIVGGETNGRRGYVMTFVIAYIRDVGYEFDLLCEALETSVSWDKAKDLFTNIKAVISREIAKFDITRHVVMCRVTQVYDTGCCLYFYFGINAKNLKNPGDVILHLENVVRNEMIAMGGSISHHHGVGKLRRNWYEKSVSPMGLNLFRTCKSSMDPNNIFGSVNFTDSLNIDE